MRYALVTAALIVSAAAHGLVTSIEGANGVSMPGLSGTPTSYFPQPFKST